MVEVKCKTHPKYRALRKPRTALGCGTCELLWDLRCGAALETEARDRPYRFSSLVAATVLS